MSAGRPYIVGITGCIHDGWLLLSNIDKTVHTEYLYYILNSDAVQKQFSDRAIGGVVKNLNTTRVSDISIPVPSLAEQEKIIAEVNAIEEKIAELEFLMAGVRDKKKAVLDKFLQ